MFLKQKCILLNSMILINSMWKIKPGEPSESTQDPRDEEIKCLKNELKRMNEKMNLMNETLVSKTTQQKSVQVNLYAAAKHYIEKFEKYFGANLELNMSLVNKDRTPEAKNREIHRQKCNYILEKIRHAHQVDHLLTRLSKHMITNENFCGKIADAYEIITEKLESGQESSKNGSLFNDPEMNQCFDILILSFTGFHPKFEGSNDFIQVPKSLYLDWMKKDAQIAVLKRLHDEEMKYMEDSRNKYQNDLEQLY